MNNQDISNLSPEELVSLLNKGELKTSITNSRLLPSPANVVESPQTTPFPLNAVPIEVFQEKLKTEVGSQPVDNNLKETVKESRFDGIMIDNPFKLLLLLDEHILSGAVTLHDWQIQFMLDFAMGGDSDKFPFQAIVRACNGSGKDKYVIAPCVVWLCMRYKKSIGVVTSASGTQLDNQTCRYIKQLCEMVNNKFGFEVWNTKYRSYICHFGEGDKSDSKSEIFCYATDEAGKAEGYHPTDFGAKMGIFVSEDKTVADDINVALNKCTGYTHRCHVSTPGLPQGHFFDYDSVSIPRKSIGSVFDVKPIDWIQYHVTAYDCSHISKDYIEQMRRDLPGHENGAAFKSQILAEFGTTDEMVVIPHIYVRQAIRKPPIWIQEPFNKAGLDLSDGGDETVLTIRNGNRHLATLPFKFDNTEDTIEHLNNLFGEWELDNAESFIFADMGGLGKPMLDRMKRQGWSNIRYIDNRTAAARPSTYKNRGAELYFNLRLLFERGEIILIDDLTLMQQLSTRYYKLVNGSVHQLLSKVESRSRGHKSPDRADSFALAFWDYKSTYVEQIITSIPFEKKVIERVEDIPHDFDLNVWANKGTKKFNPEHVESDKSDLAEAIADFNQQRRLVSRN